jgi:uncharacterized protein (TIGR03435 family)
MNAQSAPPDRPSFEAASIKPSNAPGLRITEDPGQVDYTASVTYLLRKAYGLFESQVIGPAWLQSDNYRIHAKIPPAASKDRIHQVPLMLQSLLQERFKLAFHFDKKTLNVYALVVAEKGSKMQPAKPDDPADEGCVSAYVPGGPNARQCHLRMPDLARELQEIMQEGAPVIDRTELQGIYDFKLSWTGPVMLAMGRDGVGIHDALPQQLGLKLSPRKEPVDVMVIDHVERPSEN